MDALTVIDDIHAKLCRQPFGHAGIAAIAEREGAVMFLSVPEIVTLEVQDDAGIQVFALVAKREIVLLRNLWTLPYILPFAHIVVGG